VPPEQLPRLAGGNRGGGLMYAGHFVHAEKLVKRKRLKFPAPYFGGKSKVAPLVWNRFGDVDNFIEPFVGSGAVLLARPSPPRVETINDLDCYVCNVWRSLKYDPDGVAVWADDVVSEADLHSRHRWLVGAERPEPVVPGRFADDPLAREAYLAGFLGEERTYAAAFRQKVRTDPHYYDVKLAGWYLWGMCAWIGGGWCATPEAGAVHGPVGGSGGRRPKIDEGVHYGNGVHAKGDRPHLSEQMPRERGRGDAAAGPGLHQKRPCIGGGSQGNKTGNARGVNAGRPQLADAYSRGRGVHGTDAADRYLSEKRPRISGPGQGTKYGDGIHAKGDAPWDGSEGTCASRRAWLIDWFSRLRDRLRTVRVCSGHWLRVCDSESVTTRLGVTGIFADPPYPHSNPDGSSSRSEGLYAQDDPDKIRDELLAYCLERGDNPMMRICVAGYDTDGYAVLEGHGWEVVAWQAQGGYSNRSKGNKNKNRERLWFSPGCVKPDLGLFRDFA
jgi:hypothetical protein